MHCLLDKHGTLVHSSGTGFPSQSASSPPCSYCTLFAVPRPSTSECRSQIAPARSAFPVRERCASSTAFAVPKAGYSRLLPIHSYVSRSPPSHYYFSRNSFRSSNSTSSASNLFRYSNTPSCSHWDRMHCFGSLSRTSHTFASLSYDSTSLFAASSRNIRSSLSIPEYAFEITSDDTFFPILWRALSSTYDSLTHSSRNVDELIDSRHRQELVTHGKEDSSFKTSDGKTAHDFPLQSTREPGRFLPFSIRLIIP